MATAACDAVDPHTAVRLARGVARRYGLRGPDADDAAGDCLLWYARRRAWVDAQPRPRATAVLQFGKYVRRHILRAARLPRPAGLLLNDIVEG